MKASNTSASIDPFILNESQYLKDNLVPASYAERNMLFSGDTSSIRTDARERS